MAKQRAQEEDGAALLDRQASLHARSAFVARLDDDAGASETGHHRVSLGKRPAARFLARPELGDLPRAADPLTVRPAPFQEPLRFFATFEVRLREVERSVAGSSQSPPRVMRAAVESLGTPT